MKKILITLEIPIPDTFVPFDNADKAQVDEWIKYNLGHQASISQSNPLCEYELLEDTEVTNWVIS